MADIDTEIFMANQKLTALENEKQHLAALQEAVQANLDDLTNKMQEKIDQLSAKLADMDTQISEKTDSVASLQATKAGGTELGGGTKITP